MDNRYIDSPKNEVNQEQSPRRSNEGKSSHPQWLTFLVSILDREKRIKTLSQENKALKDQCDKLANQSSSMKEGMRRCVTCDYRLASKSDD